MNLVFRGSGCVRVSFLVDGEIAQGEGVKGVEEGRIAINHGSSI